MLSTGKPFSLATWAAHAYNPSIYSNLTFDTVKDFVEVVPLAGQPNVLAVAPSTGIKTVGELIAAANRSTRRRRDAHDSGRIL